MGKKKPFINRKNSATFQLLARDTSDPSASSADPASDRVFVRVDNNPYSIPGLDEEIQEEYDEFADESIFADADEDDEEGGGKHVRREGELADHVRKEIIELGLPDDGYNYLAHLREIRNSGGGSTFYQNSKAKLDQVPLDVKAYDASRLRISANASDELNNESNSFYKVASKAIGVKVQRAVDPDIAKLLDDTDFLSRFGSDSEDLDEDFVLKANVPDEDDDDDDDEDEDEVVVERKHGSFLKDDEKFADVDGDDEIEEVNDKPRVRRLLDEQFDELTLREYDDDSDDKDANYPDTDDEPLAAKINDALKPFAMNELKLEDKYRAPGDFMTGQEGSEKGEELDLPTDIIKKCVEYAEKYCNESQDDKEVVIVEESSDESEAWDCETIISTYSNLDNHPGKIQAPGNPKNRVPRTFPGESVSKGNLIELRGKQKLPVEFLPSNKRAVERVKVTVSSGTTDKQNRKPHGEESKLEKKERKAAVKEERREARRAKKELKVLYKSEAQKAQKVAAVTGPSSVHLM